MQQVRVGRGDDASVQQPLPIGIEEPLAGAPPPCVEVEPGSIE
jgi:hypothetical protein